MNGGLTYGAIEARELAERERVILRSIVQLYVLTANPVGSKPLAKYIEEQYKLSPATIRNIMSALEDAEFITHPHTSAGRIPTDKGYRFYVDSLMSADKISNTEAENIRENLISQPTETALREASKILGSLSHYLSVVELPQVYDSIIRRVQLIELSSTRILVVLELDSNIVRTVTLEVKFDFDRFALDDIARFLNERIAGRRASFIRESFKALISDASIAHAGMLRLFTESVDALFSRFSSPDERLHISGAQNLLTHPEFGAPERIRGVVELVENHDIIVHIFDKIESRSSAVSISIGQELGHELLADYSVISTSYLHGSSSASIGVIGPKRMNYARIASILECVGSALSSRSAIE